jgi:isopenicillin N synthase-like dioxygenase
VDRKRVLDLSPERLKAIETADPELLQLDNSGLNKALSFWDKIRQLSFKTTQALAKAIGTEDVLKDTAFNYRMVDYYATNTNAQQVSAVPRCGEHRDFGWYTLIFAKEPGLQIQVDDGSWIDVRPSVDGGALLLFGWCTQIRSNGRIRAALHRVAIADNDEAKRRTTAVFFVAPKDCETSLDPVVRPGTEQQYISGVKVGQLRGNMARKWQKREGTLSEKNHILEEEEIRVTKMETQDDVVQSTITV